jgi:hypothetical protein
MQIYIYKNNEQFGPFGSDQIEAYINTNVFSMDDLAWSEGEADWIPLSDLLVKQNNIQDVEDVGILPSPVEIQLPQAEEAKILTVEIAEQFLKNNDSVALIEFTTIEDYAACVLARHKGEIWLNGLKSLSDAAARLLSEHKGFLSLNGLEFLSDESARALAYHGGEIADLSVLEGLNDAAAKFITAEPATARNLLAQHGRLDLKGLTSLSDAAAEALSCQKGFLSLSGLKSLSDSSAEALSRHEGFLDLSGVASLSDSSARSLANIFRKGFLWLEGQAEEACKVARFRAREGLKTATNLTKQILASTESIDPKKMRTQILELEKLHDIAGVPKNSREGVKQIKKALAELETKIAQAKLQAQAQAQSKARAKAKAEAEAEAEAKAQDERSEFIKNTLLFLFFVVTPILGIIFLFILCTQADSLTDSQAHFFIIAGMLGIGLPGVSFCFVAAMGGSSDPQTRNAQIAMIQRQQMMNKIDDIRSEFNEE